MQYSVRMTNRTWAYDAFMSYSHAADGLLAPALQAELERIARPWYRLRALRIFRDQTNLSAHPDLWASIEASLNQARWFVLLASERAAASKWVEREVQWWLAHRDEHSLLVVLTDGELAWSDEAGGFDLAHTTALPASLLKLFAHEPLHVDLRWAKGPQQLDQRSLRFRSAVLDVAATLRGVSKDELDGEAVRTLRRNRAWAMAAAAALMAASAWAWQSREQALREALSNALDLEARQVVSIAATKRQADALPMAIAVAARSLKAFGTVSLPVLGALRQAIEDSREIARWDAGGQVNYLSFDEKSRGLVTLMRKGTARRWSLDGVGTDLPLQDADPIKGDDDGPTLRFSASGAAILAHVGEQRWRAWRLDGKALLGGRQLAGSALEVSAITGDVFLVDASGRLMMHPHDRKDPIVLRQRLPARLDRLLADPVGRWLVLVYEDQFIDVVQTGSRRMVELGRQCAESTRLVERGNALRVVGCGRTSLWNLPDGSLRHRAEHPALALPDGLTTSDDGAFAVSREGDHRVQLFTPLGLPAMGALMGVEQPSAALSSDGSMLALAGYLDGRISIFDLADRSSVIPPAPLPASPVAAIAACPDRPHIFSATMRGQLFALDRRHPGDAPVVWSPEGEEVTLLRCLPGGGAVVMRRDKRIEHWLAPKVMHPLRADGQDAREGLTVALGRRAVYALGERHVERWRSDASERLERLPDLVLPHREAGWRTIALGQDDRLLVLGSYNGDLLGLDATSGQNVFGPDKVFWSNTWSLSRDAADGGFVAAGAGTEVTLFEWTGRASRRFQTDRFMFAANTAVDSRRRLLAMPTPSGEVLLRDLDGNDVGPPIRRITHDGIVDMQFTTDGMLVTGDPIHGVAIHDVDAQRLLALACRLWQARRLGAQDATRTIEETARRACTTPSG